MRTTENSGDGGCKCPACLASEDSRDAFLPPYRSVPGRGLTVLHLLLQSSLPLVGMVLIGWSWHALVPLAGSAAAYLLNSFVLCPTCAYHHAGVRSCGCYPKSVFSYRLYGGRRWGLRENLLGRGGVLLLSLVPSAAVLAMREDISGVILLLCQAVAILFIMSVVSCPACRQRDVCALGRLAASGIKRKDL